MPVGSQHKNDYFRFVDFIHHTVFLGYLTAPLSGSVPSQRFGMPRSCFGVDFHLL